MIETFLRDLREPKYIHVLINSFRDFRCALREFVDGMLTLTVVSLFTSVSPSRACVR
jgi:hypothetical protein